MERFVGATSWDLEQSYEVRGPRALKKAKKAATESSRLPIKTASGIIVQRPDTTPSPEPTESDDEESEDEEDKLKAEESRRKRKAEEEAEEESRKPKVPEKQRVLEAKEELAKIATAVNEDPEENMHQTKRMREMIDDHNTTISKLAILAMMAVYKSVIPGYRIRPLTEAEEKVKVTKEIKKLRLFEQGILSGYQQYLKKLGELLRRSRKPDAPPSATGVGRAAATAAAGLLTSVPHFNFRSELLKLVVEVVSVRTVDETFVKCRTALEELFRTDEDGNASLEAVQLMTKMMKAKHFRVDESVLNTFLHLRLLSEFDRKASMDRVDKHEDNMPKLKKKHREFRTKKARKFAKEEKEVELEMREADATVSHEEREKKQSETLKLVFVTYFKILKERPEGLMGATLEGLAKFAHLINLDFFGDLLVALRELISDSELETTSVTDAVPNSQSTSEDRNTVRESLLCIITAFTLLYHQSVGSTGADKILNVDLTFFTNHLYSILLPLSLNADIEYSQKKSLHLPDPDAPHQHIPKSKVNVSTMAEMLIRALDALFFQQNSATNPLRIAAFTKRLMTSALHVPEKSALAELGIINKLGKRHFGRVVGLWSSEESVGDGAFDMQAEEPERSNPYAASVWEAELLRNHYSPKVAEAVREMEKTMVVKNEAKRGPRR